MCLFSAFEDSIMITEIMSWLELTDILHAQSVSKRWLFSGSHSSLWGIVDLTKIVKNLFKSHERCKDTSLDVEKTLTSILKKHGKLVISLTMNFDEEVVRGLRGESVGERANERKSHPLLN
tara:strand:- start:292 stop:654 length:363 start_codon:yes stop_codon:yes gene_type:complete